VSIEVDLWLASWPSGSAYPPVFTEIGPLSGWYGLTWQDHLDQNGECQVTVSGASYTPEVRAWLRHQYNTLTEIRVTHDGILRWAGPVTGISAQQTGSGAYAFQFRAAGLFIYLSGLLIAPGKQRVFTGVDQHTIAKTLIDQAQSLPWHNFGVDTSSITASGVVRDREYNPWAPIGETVRQLSKVDDGFDVWVTPDRVVHCAHPEAGEDQRDQIIFDNRNTTNIAYTLGMGWGDYLSAAVVLGDVPEGSASGTLQPAVEVTSPTVLSRIGYRGFVSNASDKTSNAATLTAVATRALAPRDEPALIASPALLFGEIPPYELDLGDRFTLEWDPPGLDEPFVVTPRVIARRFSVAESGDLTMTVETQ
jgi:hypothetical protein